MQSNSGFFEKLRMLQPLSKLFMAGGVLGVVATFLTGQQTILTWSAVSIGLGLALGFFREAFRPRAGHQHEHDIEIKSEPVRLESHKPKRSAAATVFASGLVLTLVSGVVVRRLLGRPFNPWRLLLVGFLSLIIINIVLFCANLFTAMGSMRGAKNEGELEQIMVPALQGEPRQLGGRVLDAFRLLTSLSAGFTVGAAILSVLKLYGV
jgi:hypothetical protein